MLTNANNVMEQGRTVVCRLKDGSTVLPDIISVSYSTDFSGAITIGQCVGSSISVTMKTPSSNLSGRELTLEMGVGYPATYTQIGLFTVDTNSYVTKQGQTRFRAYDRMQRMSRAFNVSSLPETTTLQNIFRLACVQAGFTQYFTIQSTDVSREDVTGYNLRDIIGFCASYNGKNAYINAAGNVEFRWFGSSTSWTANSKTANFPESNDAQISISRLICNAKDGTLTSGTGSAIYFSNPIMTQARLNTLKNSLQISYNTADAEIPFGNFLLESGKDVIEVSSRTDDTAKAKIPVMNLSWEYDGGLSSRAQSFGAATYDNSNTNPVRSSSQRRIDTAIQQKRETSAIVTNAVQHATEQITGASGGYIRITYGGDGKTAELLVMDTPSIETAQNVWRLNQGGFGHSSTGYGGAYTTAITADGWIVAERIAGTLISGLKFRTSTQNGWYMELGEAQIAAKKVIGSQTYEMSALIHQDGETYAAVEKPGMVYIYDNANAGEEFYLCDDMANPVFCAGNGTGGACHFYRAIQTDDDLWFMYNNQMVSLRLKIKQLEDRIAALGG